MSIKMTQTCELCGKTRDLPTNSNRPPQPSPDSGGWRLLSYGAKEATACDGCLKCIVEYALSRTELRKEGNDVAALTLTIFEWKEE